MLNPQVPRQPRLNGIRARMLPCDHSHAQQKISLSFNLSSASFSKHFVHFVQRVSPLYGSRRVMPCEAAAIQREACVDQGQVQWRTNQIIDQHGVPRHAQGFASKAGDLIGLQMMGEERAADGIKAVVGKGKGQRVTTDGGKLAVHVRYVEIEQSWLRGNVFTLQRLLRS